MFFLHSICIFILNHIVHKLSWRIMIPPWDGMGQDCGNSEITNCDKIVEPSIFWCPEFWHNIFKLGRNHGNPSYEKVEGVSLMISDTKFECHLANRQVFQTAKTSVGASLNYGRLFVTCQVPSRNTIWDKVNTTKVRSSGSSSFPHEKSFVSGLT